MENEDCIRLYINKHYTEEDEITGSLLEVIINGLIWELNYRGDAPLLIYHTEGDKHILQIDGDLFYPVDVDLADLVNDEEIYDGYLFKMEEAIKYIEDFNAGDALLTARKFGCIADAFAEQNQMEKAIENYKKAADAADNEITTPTYLYRAALALEQKGNKKEALELYKKVNKNYPASQEGMASEIYIAKLEAQTL